jgi:hypothetical protein
MPTERHARPARVCTRMTNHAPYDSACASAHTGRRSHAQKETQHARTHSRTRTHARTHAPVKGLAQVCGLCSHPELTLLCDGCPRELHMACTCCTLRATPSTLAAGSESQGRCGQRADCGTAVPGRWGLRAGAQGRTTCRAPSRRWTRSHETRGSARCSRVCMPDA